jgi:FkbM family methyltransferase
MPLARLLGRSSRVPFAEWGHEVREFVLPREGAVQFAQWRHPCDRPAAITQEEVDGLRRYIQAGDLAIDIGAHSGDTTLPMALAAGPAGLVLALEPNPYVFEVLRQNALLNRQRARIAPLCFAATETDGSYVFHYGDASFCNGGMPLGRRWTPWRRKYPLKVTGHNLLRFLREDYAPWLPRLAYVKVDAEGADRAILESILPLIREVRPVIRTEVFRKLPAHERRRLFDLLTGSGYDLFRFEGGAQPQGRAVDRRHMTAERHFDILALPREGRERRAA